MTINYRRARTFLEKFDITALFVEELGWARATARTETLTVKGEKYRLAPVAELGGVMVYTCEPIGAQDVPETNLRKRIEKDVLKLAHEHIIIFVDAARTKAVWLWVKREAGVTAKPREHTYHKGQPGDSLLQKLAGIAFKIDDLDAEGRASVLAVVGRVANAFDIERVTKRFYEQFKVEHTALLKFIKGIDSADDRAWYTSVMLNRLMFIYFIQKKGFLNADMDYLRHKLEASKLVGANRFYRYFLTTLFFDGFAHEPGERSREVKQLLEDVPYLNGGLFQPHPVEVQYGEAISIPDSVFERLFSFFDAYTWHLDDRPLRADNEINPDVLGFIFEKYINQKQMGAYYTKEDITGYICRNTILPFLLDKLGTLHYDAVHPLPLKDIEPYLYPAVKQAEPLPTETDRELAARHQRLAQIHTDFRAGKIAAINDLITYNLDIEQFTRDFLKNLDKPLVLRAFYFECLLKVTVLDPAVGSGAFLFAAMNILQPLYEICLDKMRPWAGPKYPDFKDELARIDEHPNRPYFIFKSIIVNNLFGVDIMEEATEICKLRLFLKLVAQVDDPHRIEPLPDIDFNIRAGNTLVGYASLKQIEAAGNFFTLLLAPKVREIDAALRAFRDLQIRKNISARTLEKAKSDIKTSLKAIEAELNETLRNEYGALRLDKFVDAHRPFHWYVEFNQIMQDDGFDVIVGNPPYIEYKSVQGSYRIRGYETEPCGNLYAFMIERSLLLLRDNGRLGMIVPVASVCTDGYSTLQSVLRRQTSCHTSFYNDRPGKLFDGLEHIRLAIILSQRSSIADRARLYTTRYQKWLSKARNCLFQLLAYADSTEFLTSGSFAKVESGLEVGILRKLQKDRKTLVAFEMGSGKNFLYYTRKLSSFVQVLDFIPKIVGDDGKVRPPSELKDYSFGDSALRDSFLAVFNSSVFYWYLTVYSDCRNLNRREMEQFPFDPSALSIAEQRELGMLARLLMLDFRKNSKMLTMAYATIGTLNIQCIYPRHSKAIIDDIDAVLAGHYGLSTKELDFITNFDIKFRLGVDEGDVN